MEAGGAEARHTTHIEHSLHPSAAYFLFGLSTVRNEHTSFSHNLLREEAAQQGYVGSRQGLEAVGVGVYRMIHREPPLHESASYFPFSLATSRGGQTLFSCSSLLAQQGS